MYCDLLVLSLILILVLLSKESTTLQKSFLLLTQHAFGSIRSTPTSGVAPNSVHDRVQRITQVLELFSYHL